MNYFCTLFDSNYLSRGLAMYESLSKHCNSFHLYIFAFDDLSFKVLSDKKLYNVTVISLSEFEDLELLAVKPTRSAGEYCWTCTPSIIKYSIDKYDLPICTYLDADLYFFNDPAVLIEEMGDKSILITEHRYTPEYDYSETSGIYCVQFMTFKNDINGMEALNWWRNECLNWCYARFEDGKFGDQKYLDDWTVRFEGVHVLENLGGGVAPWNIQQYNLSDDASNLIFYHFHNFKFLNGGLVDLGDYKLKKFDVKFLYIPYISHLDSIHSDVVSEYGVYDYHGTVFRKEKITWKTPFRYAKKKIKKQYNIFRKDQLIGG